MIIETAVDATKESLRETLPEFTKTLREGLNLIHELDDIDGAGFRAIETMMVAILTSTMEEKGEISVLSIALLDCLMGAIFTGELTNDKEIFVARFINSLESKITKMEALHATF